MQTVESINLNWKMHMNPLKFDSSLSTDPVYLYVWSLEAILYIFAQHIDQHQALEVIWLWNWSRVADEGIA